LSGKEFAGRLIALEAVVTAVAGQLAATLPPDRAQAMLAAVKAASKEMVDDLAPEFSPTPPMVKEIEQFADKYVDLWLDMIGKTSATIAKAVAAKPAA
jgi:hypothetical protein